VFSRLLAPWASALCALVPGCGEHQGPGAVTNAAVPAQALEARTERQHIARHALNEASGESKQILFGDLHVHTTFSADAFAIAPPHASSR
jgi:hypothetical protein